MRSPLKLAFALTLLVHPASWAQDAIDFDPLDPKAEVPLRLILTGASSGGCGFPGTLHSLTIEDSTIRVESLRFLGPCGLAPPTPPYVFTADVGLLPAGGYTVEHVALVFGTEDEEVIATRELFVDSGVAVEVMPDRPTSTELVTLQLTGVGSCPIVGTPEVAGSEIRVSWDPGPCLSPPVIHTDTTEPFGPLAAGDYDVVVHDGSVPESPLGTTQLRVYPDPVPVRDGRFEIDVTWRDFEGADGRGQLVIPPSEDSTLFWFFNPQNWELMVKVLDGCEFNDHFWVFAAASTDVEYTIVVRDVVEDREWTFTNPLGVASPAVNDTQAFACP